MTRSRFERFRRRKPLWAAAAVCWAPAIYVCASSFGGGPSLALAWSEGDSSLPPAPLPMIEAAERLPASGDGFRIRPVSTTLEGDAPAPSTTTLRLLPTPSGEGPAGGTSARRTAAPPSAEASKSSTPAKPEGDPAASAPQSRPFSRDSIRERPAASFRSASPALSGPKTSTVGGPSVGSGSGPALTSTPVAPLARPAAAASLDAPKASSTPALGASTARIVDRTAPSTPAFKPSADDAAARAEGAASVHRPTAIEDAAVVPLGPIPQPPREPAWSSAERLAGPAYSARTPIAPTPTAAASSEPSPLGPSPVASQSHVAPAEVPPAPLLAQTVAGPAPQPSAAAFPTPNEWGRPVNESSNPWRGGGAGSFPERSGQPAPSDAASGERPLEVKNIAFCWKVEGFGTYEPLPEARFRPGQEILVYLELDHFSSEWTRQGHRTVTETACRIYDAEGTVVASRRFPTSVDLCRSRRRDYFQTLRFQLPADLPPGDYHFELFVGDRIRNAIARGMAPFRLIAPQIVRGHGPAPTPAPVIYSSPGDANR